MASLLWLDPGSPAERLIPFLNIRSTEMIVLLGPPAGIQAHFVGGRTQPHLDENCPHCPLKIQPAYYAAARLLFNGPDGKRRLPERILSIPPFSEPRFSRPDLRGRLLTVRRHGSELLIVKDEHLPNALPPGFDLREQLHRHWFGARPAAPPAEPVIEPAATLFDALEPRQILPFERPDPELPVRAPALQPGQRPAEGGAS